MVLNDMHIKQRAQDSKGNIAIVIYNTRMAQWMILFIESIVLEKFLIA